MHWNILFSGDEQCNAGFFIYHCRIENMVWTDGFYCLNNHIKENSIIVFKINVSHRCQKLCGVEFFWGRNAEAMLFADIPIEPEQVELCKDYQKIAHNFINRFYETKSMASIENVAEISQDRCLELIKFSTTPRFARPFRKTTRPHNKSCSAQTMG